MKQQFCQSCTMPLDKEDILGTEADGSHSREYCKYCYLDGVFTSPGMSMKDMETIVKTQMAKMQIPQAIIDQSVRMLPELKRWKK